MAVYTYTVFDADPNSSSGTEWPSHTDVEIEADSDDEAVEGVRDAMRVEAAGLNPGDGYDPDDTIHAIVWSDDGTIVGQPTYVLTHEDLGVHTPEESRVAAIKALSAVEVDGDEYAYYADETSSWWIVTEDELAEWLDYPERDRYSHWCAGTSGREMPEGWSPDA